MKSSVAIRNVLIDFNQNELIFASKLYKEKLSASIREVTYYKMLERMCKSGELAKIAKGIYYIPQMTKYGVVPPSESDIVDAFTHDATGTVVGYAMYNKFNLTTQITKVVNVFSSSVDGVTKTVKNVSIKHASLVFSPEVIQMVQIMEVLQNYYSIQDLNKYSFLKFAELCAKTFENEVFEEVIAKITYKKSTIAFLREILNYYGISHNLEKYLSSLSTYKHPKMEELYETSRVSN